MTKKLNLVFLLLLAFCRILSTHVARADVAPINLRHSYSNSYQDNSNTSSTNSVSTTTFVVVEGIVVVGITAAVIALAKIIKKK